MRGHRRRVARRGRILVVALLASVVLSTGGTTVPAGAGEGTTTTAAGQSVETTFAATGPWAVTDATATVPGTPGVRLVYPTDLGADGYDHPIVAWGNASGVNCSDEFGASGAQLRHLASWGFAVVCLQSPDTGWGTGIWTAVQWLIGRNGDPSSVFFGRLDTANVGAIGHSQGATGVTNATVLADGVITSTVAIALVNPERHNPRDQLPEFGEVGTPIFFISGEDDDWATQEWQDDYYGQVAGPRAMAAREGTGHFLVTDFTRGYWTAWLRYTLADDALARSAFVTTGGRPPEVSTNSDWTNWLADGLP